MFDTQLEISADLEMDIMRWESYVLTFCQNSNQEINESFIDLAHYASFPVILSSDLLYKIYLNFIASGNKSEKILQIWEASEFLFSPIIKELGYDLYEIHPGLRLSLRNKLNKFKKNAEYPENKRIAFFMKEYVEKCKNNFQSNQIEQAQIINYQIELEPEKAVFEVLKRISEAKGNPVGNHVGYLLEYAKTNLGIGNSKSLESTEALLKGINKQNSNDIEKALKGFDIGEETADGIKILIPIDVKITSLTEKPTKRKLKALVIGIGNKKLKNIMEVDVNSAELFAEKLESLLPLNEIECNLITGFDTTKNNILTVIESTIKDITQKDDLLFYIASNAVSRSGKCEICCIDLQNENTNGSSENLYLSDAEIGEKIKDLDCASITIILQIDHAASPYWLENIDNFKSKTIVFASCKFDQSPTYFNQKIEEKEVCAFTKALVESMTSSKNNRNIFADSIQKISKYSQGEENNKNVVLQNKTPILIGNPETYNLNFINGADEDYLLKNQFFKANYTDKTAYEISFDELVALKKTDENLNDNTTAFKDYRSQSTIKLEKINKLNSELPPIFLLIYSDFTQKLGQLKKEKSDILNILKLHNIVVLLLENPDKVTFENLLKSPKYRNRIQLIYYSGSDDNEGNIIFNKKAFDINEFARLLNYQENLKLFFSNTCRSKFYAEYLTQMGVKYSYGFEGTVSDDLATVKGVEFFKNLALGESSQNLFKILNYDSNSR